ncbi:hypothetical protein AgCh_037899 [Apium graveolens]
MTMELSISYLQDRIKLPAYCQSYKFAMTCVPKTRAETEAVPPQFISVVKRPDLWRKWQPSMRKRMRWNFRKRRLIRLSGWYRYAPSATITENENRIYNPKYCIWFRQDKFIHSAIVESVLPTLDTLVFTAKSSKVAWDPCTSHSPAIYAPPVHWYCKQQPAMTNVPKMRVVSEAVSPQFISVIRRPVDKMATIDEEENEMASRISGK